MTTLVLQPGESTALDTFIASTSGLTDWNFGIGSNVQAGRQISPSGYYRTLLKFDLSSLPANAYISQATLTLNCTGGENSNAQNFSVHRSLVQWYEGNENGAVPNPVIDSSTWNHRNYNGSVAWSGGAGGGSGSDYAASATATTSVSTFIALYDWDVTLDVRNFYNGTVTNHGWWLRGDEGAANGRKIFSSSFNAANAPKLTIVYTVPNVSTQDSIQVAESSSVYAERVVGLQDSLLLGESVGVSVYVEGDKLPTAQDSASVSDTATLEVTAGQLSVQQTISITENAVPAVQPVTPVTLTVQDTVTVDSSPAVFLLAGLDTVLENVALTDTATLHVQERVSPPLRYALPLLYLTDGVHEGGRLRKFNLLSRHSAYLLCGWEPTIAQQKNGGIYTESALVSGRRLVSFAYENPVEVLTLQANAIDQNSLIQYTRELFDWLERAAEYWTSRFAKNPIYLVARSAYETETRYAVIYNASIPKLQNPYGPEFYNKRNAFFSNVEVYLERGHWLDHPPDESECAALSTNFVWSWPQAQIVEAGSAGGVDCDTVTGTIKALIEADDGTVLAGSTDAAKVYGSTDDGRCWTLLYTIGSGSDTINAFTKDGSGNLYAAVSGATAVGGVWRSTDDGASWTRVFGGTVTDVSGRTVQDWQCYDVLFAPTYGYIHAVGDGHVPDTYLVAGRYPTFANSQNGTTWDNCTNSFLAYRAVGIAVDRGIWPNVLFVKNSVNAWIFYSAKENVASVPSYFGTHLGPYATGGYDLTGWPSSLPAPNPYNLLASLKTTGGSRFYKLYLSGNYFYAPVGSEIADTVFAIYVDPTNTTPAQRLYAGGDGTIYISQNDGFAWSTLTTTPTGEVHSFLRTDTSMLAGGEDGIILLEGGDLPGGTTPDPSSSAVVQAQVSVGQDNTCGEPGVYVGNQHTESSLTNILQYDDSVGMYTELYPMTVYPVELYPSVPDTNDAVYFGVQSDMTETDGGPFASLVFVLDEDQLGQDLTVVWEYWSGAIWDTLLVQDDTSGFTAYGLHAIAWQIAAANWATTNVQGILGWWVRARLSAVGSNPQSPRQLDVNVFTPNNTFAEIDSGDIGGDIPALSHLVWQNAGDKDNGANYPHGYVDRLLVGLRSYNRGPIFNSIINLSDEQTPFGFTLTPGTYSTWNTSNLAPTARLLYTTLSTPQLATWLDLVTIDIANTIADNYFGTFRVLARCYNPAGSATDWRLRLSVKFGSGGNVSYSKNYPYVATTNTWHVVDFGSITVPSEQSVTGNVGDTMQLIVQGWGATETVALFLFDLILIPTDEWSVDVLRPSYSAVETGMRVSEDDYFDINSLLTKASSVVGTNRAANGLIKAYYQVVTNGKGILQVNARQRLWFFAMTQVGNADWVAYPHALGRVKINRVQRYKAMRGVS